jgi:hypothetical protein
VIAEAGHFLQEDAGPELAAQIATFVAEARAQAPGEPGDGAARKA